MFAVATRGGHESDATTTAWDEILVVAAATEASVCAKDASRADD